MSLLHTRTHTQRGVLLLERMRNRIEDERDFLTRFFECCCFKRSQKKGGENVCWMKREATRENPIASTTFQILVWMMAKKEGGGGSRSGGSI